MKPPTLLQPLETLSLARQAAILENAVATLQPSTITGVSLTIQPTELGRSRNKSLSGLGLSSIATRALANDPQAMFEASPFCRIKRRPEVQPFSRVSHDASASFETIVRDLRRDYYAWSRGGGPIPLPQRGEDIHDPPPAWVSANSVSRTSKGKSPITELHHRLNPLAIIHTHFEANKLAPCQHCANSTCFIFHVAALASGPPLPILPGLRPEGSLNKSVYPLSVQDQTCVTAELGGYVLQGVVHPVDLDTKTIEHPIFAVSKHRYAPDKGALDAFYASGGFRSHLTALARSVVQDARSLQKQLFPSSSATRLDPAIITEALNKHRTDPKIRMVVDYGRVPGIPLVAEGRQSTLSLNQRLADWPFRYVSLGHILSSIQRNWVVCSFDISAAFVTIPVHPADRHLLALRWPKSGSMQTNGKLLPGDEWIKCVQHRQLFGSCHMPALFSTVSAEVVSTLTRRAAAYASPGSILFYAYMDDIFCLAEDRTLCEKGKADVLAYTASIGANLNDKCREPAQRDIPILGVIVDTIDMTVSLPVEKAYSTAFLCAVAIELLDNGITPSDNLWSKLFGKLEHASYATSGGAGRLSRIRATLVCSSSQSPGDRFTVSANNTQLMESLRWWLRTLSDSPPSSRLFVTCAPSSSAAEFRIRSDASGDQGASLLLGDSLVMHCLWTSETARHPSIQRKELYPIVLLVERYGYLFSSLPLPFGVDNIPIVYGVNKRSLRDESALDWLIYLSDLADEHRILLLPSWVPREANNEADVSSKVYSADQIALLYPSFLRRDL